MTQPKLTDADRAPLFFDLTKDTSVARGILGDLCGTNYAKKGSAWGYGLTSTKAAWKDASMSGVFTTQSRDTVTVVWDHAQQFAMLSEMQVKFDIAILLTSNNFDSAQTESKVRAFSGTVVLPLKWDAQTHGSGWAENAADKLKGMIPTILSKIDQIRVASKSAKPLNVLVVCHRENPFSWTDAAAQFIAAASIIASFVPGLPKDVISKASRTLNTYLTSHKVDVAAIMDCALAIAPDSLRKTDTVQRGLAVYGSLAKNDYLGAAKAVGIDVPGLLTSFQKTTDWTQISKTAKIGFDGAVSALQNMLSADAVNKLAGGLRSGSLVMDTITSGSITAVKQFQDAVLGGINPQTVMTLIPQPYNIAKTILNETQDITSGDEFRAIVGLGCGIGVGDNILDNLSIKAIASRVNDVLSDRYSTGVKDLQYSLSTSIDKEKREWFASEVNRLTGAQILTNPSDSSVSSNIRKAAPYIAIGGAAVAALYFYRK